MRGVKRDPEEQEKDAPRVDERLGGHLSLLGLYPCGLLRLGLVLEVAVFLRGEDESDLRVRDEGERGAGAPSETRPSAAPPARASGPLLEARLLRDRRHPSAEDSRKASEREEETHLLVEEKLLPPRPRGAARRLRPGTPSCRRATSRPRPRPPLQVHMGQLDVSSRGRERGARRTVLVSLEQTQNRALAVLGLERVLLDKVLDEGDRVLVVLEREAAELGGDELVERDGKVDGHAGRRRGGGMLRGASQLARARGQSWVEDGRTGGSD